VAQSGERSPRGTPGGIGTRGGDVLQLVVDYAKQETIGPLKGAGRFLAFGVSGSVFLSVGVAVLLVAMLRALQTETGTTFSGNLTWVPYLITAGAAIIVAGLAAWRVTKGAAARSRGDERTRSRS
jgi:Putative Actinobacterial Holin-X, holin superfamily III